MIKLKVLVYCLLVHATQTRGQVSLNAISLEKGKYEAGFRHYVSIDSTRTYKRQYDWTNNEIYRPVPLSIWFPAYKPAAGPGPIKVSDYMDILKEEEEWEYLPNEQVLNWFYYPNTPENRGHFKESTGAYADASPAPGSFPAIVYAPSYQASSIENFALCEYLASHGYVVVAAPSRGTQTRWLEGGTEKDMETQARDIEFALREIQKIPYVNASQIATAGFSFGGLSNVLSQMRNDRIRAIVSLDGSIKYQYETLKKSPFFDISRVDVPFLHMAQKDIPPQVMKEDKINPDLNTRFEFYDSIANSMAYQLKFNNMTHPYFSTLGILFQPRDTRQDKSDAEIMESYRWVARYTLAFLDAFMKGDSSAAGFMDNTPALNGVAQGLISYNSRKPEKRNPGFEDFNEWAADRNYQNLSELYTETVKIFPDFELPEDKLNNLGLQLLFNPKTSEYGIRILLLATRLYEGSANLFDSLAEGYLFVGEKEKAIRNFEKSLSLNPENQNAIDRLTQLKE